MTDFGPFLTTRLFLPDLQTSKLLELLILGECLNDLFTEIKRTYLGLMSGDITIKFSTNTTGNHHFAETRTAVKEMMDLLDIEERTLDAISQCPSRLHYL